MPGVATLGIVLRVRFVVSDSPQRPRSCLLVIGQGFWGKAGQYFCTGASRSNFPRSQSRIAVVAVNDFEVDASR